MTVAPDHAATRHTVGASARQRTRLLVVDDHAAVRAGVRDLLANEPDFDVVAAVSTAEEALAVAECQVIDLAIVDYQLGGRSGLWLSRKLERLRQSPRVLIYSAYADDVLSAAAVIAEADAICQQVWPRIRAARRGSRRGARRASAGSGAAVARGDPSSSPRTPGAGDRRHAACRHPSG